MANINKQCRYLQVDGTNLGSQLFGAVGSAAYCRDEVVLDTVHRDVSDALRGHGHIVLLLA